MPEITELLPWLPAPLIAAHYLLCRRRRRRFFAERIREIDPRWFELYRRRRNRKLWWMVTDETVELYQWSFIRVLWALEQAGVRREGRVEMSREQALLMFPLCFYGRIGCWYRIPQWDKVEERHVDLYSQMLERLVASFLVHGDRKLVDVWVPYFAWGEKQLEHVQSSEEALELIGGWAGPLSDNVSETATPEEFTVQGDGVVSHVSVYQS